MSTRYNDSFLQSHKVKNPKPVEAPQRLGLFIVTAQFSKQEGRSNEQSPDDLVHICTSFSVPCSALQAADNNRFLQADEHNFTQQTLSSEAFELGHNFEGCFYVNQAVSLQGI